MMAEGFLVYEAGKSAVIGVTRQMACEYGPSGIRVNAICPGHIVTERQGVQWKAHPDGLEFFAQQYPVRRTGTPDDIAGTIAFLASDDASFITGQAIAVDGDSPSSFRRTSAFDLRSTSRPILIRTSLIDVRRASQVSIPNATTRG